MILYVSRNASRYNRFLAVFILSAGLATTPAFAETVDGARIVVLDGDTVALPCAGPPQRGCAEKIRLDAIDAPETHDPACDNELQMGLAAKDVLVELLRSGPVDVKRSGRTDKYGRTLGSLLVGSRDAASELLNAGLALRYAPGRAAWVRRKSHWCAG